MLPAHLEAGEEVVGVAGVAGEGQDLQVLPHPGAGFPEGLRHLPTPPPPLQGQLQGGTHQDGK